MRIFLLGATPGLRSDRAAGAQPCAARDKLAQTGGNTGNQIIAYGLLRGLAYERVCWGFGFTPQRVDAEFDIILIAASNFLHTGFDFGAMAHFVEATHLPCVMVGVGAQSNTYVTDIKLVAGTARLMHVVAERSALIGARGTFTAAVLASNGIHNVQVTGCPSYYMAGTHGLDIRKPVLGPEPKLLFNSSRDVAVHSFDRERMIRVVCELLAIGTATQADFIAQSELPEITMAETTGLAALAEHVDLLLRQFPPYADVAPREVLQAWCGAHMRVFWNVANWLEAVRHYDFVFGNRFHGNLIALLAGTPACVICHDTRTEEMCDFLALPHVSLRDIDRVDYRALYDKVDPAAINRRYAELYPRYQDFLAANGLSAPSAVNPPEKIREDLLF